VFVLAGYGVTLAASAGVRERRGVAWWLAILAALWLGTFAMVYRAVAGVEAASPYMQAFWGDRFMTPRAFSDPHHLWSILRGVPIQAFVADNRAREFRP
jgi:hypothetical protein